MSFYPTAPSVPAFISVTPAASSIALGGNQIQLVASLTDANGNTISASKPFTWASSNTSLLTVSSSGLCQTASPTTTLLSVGSTRVDIVVTYPFGNRTTGETISATAQIEVTAYAGVVSIFSPLAPGISGGNAAADFVWAQNHTGSSGQGGQGFRPVPHQ
jgi:hypothetical protein